MMQRVRQALVLLVFCLLGQTLVAAELRPFTLALRTVNTMERVTEAVLESLKNHSFEIVGTYRPEADVNIYAITNKELKRVAAQSQYGGFGAVLRVSVTRVLRQDGQKEIQVAYNNPEYVGLAYRMGSRLKTVKAQLAKALGAAEDFGGAVDEERLPDYNYTLGLEGFTGFFEMGSHDSYREAIRKVETHLASNKFGISQVYRVDIPGKKQTVFGLSLKSDVNKYPFINDENVMKVIDHQDPRRSAHLPYEVLVTEGRVIAMHPHFRIAINFPDLKMFGDHGFGRLIDLPYDYEEYVTQSVGGQWPPAENW